MSYERRRQRTRWQRDRASDQLPAGLMLRLPGGECYPLDGSRTTSVGAAEGCHLKLSDPFVSQLHCRLNVRRGKLWVEDEGSRNGTWVNNVRVERCMVAPGARIDVGQTRIRVEVAGTQAESSFGMVGMSRAMQRVYDTIGRFAPARFPVLVLGETGTGKELVARALHDAGATAGGPFEVLNCAAIPAELAESELFGHMRGAFTGATQEFVGAFGRAHGGTLFLDEVGEMPIALQPKLLRALEEGEIRPVGGVRTTPVSVRLVAATHRNLAQEISRQRFREDLFYRLSVGSIELPPLRERREDILPLVAHFLEEEGEQAKGRLTREAEEALLSHCWPGNIRALKHAVWRAIALSNGAQLGVKDFRFQLGAEAREGQLEGRTLAELTQEIYRQEIRRHHGNRAAAARALGVPKSTFYDQLRSMGIAGASWESS